MITKDQLVKVLQELNVPGDTPVVFRGPALTGGTITYNNIDAVESLETVTLKIGDLKIGDKEYRRATIRIL